MGAAGVVFIDRSDRRAAIETLKPLVEAMRSEGKSLVIAPGRTRAPTRKLGAFKKGGFPCRDSIRRADCASGHP